MLTESQTIKLKNLILPTKYRKILIDAIKIWKREDVSPRTGVFGVTSRMQKNSLRLVNSNFFDKFELNKDTVSKGSYQCCLLGASLVNKYAEDSSPISIAIQLHFKLLEKETIDIHNGFDTYQKKINIEEKSPAFLFGRNVAAILFCEKEFTE